MHRQYAMVYIMIWWELLEYIIYSLFDTQWFQLANRKLDIKIILIVLPFFELRSSYFKT